MNLIKLSAIDSTNAELRRRMQGESLPDLTVVWATNQTQGRGQRGASWQSEKGKNLTFSILKRFQGLAAADHFTVNMVISNAVLRALESFQIPDLSVKWPNDILSGNRKICGILTENGLTGDRIVYSIIGIGLNVNQEEFDNLPRAGSLRTVTGRYFEIEDIFLKLYGSLRTSLGAVDSINYLQQKEMYQQNLFGFGQMGTFKSGEQTFTGEVIEVNREGRLLLKKQDGTVVAYDFKEITFLY